MASPFEPTTRVGNTLWLLVSRFARPHGGRFLLAAVATFLAQIPQLLPAFVVGVVLDAILLEGGSYAIPFVPEAAIPETTGGQIRFTVVVLALAFAADAVLTWAAGRLEGTARYRTLHDVRVEAFDAVIGHERSFFDAHQTGDVLSVLNNDVANLDRFGRNAYEGVRLSAQIVVAFAFMLSIHAHLAAVLAVVPLVLAVHCRWYVTRVESLYEAIRASVGRVNAAIEDAVEGIHTVKAFAREDAERSAVEDVSGDYRDRNWSVIRYRLAFDLASWTLISAAVIGLFAAGSGLVLVGTPPWFGGPLSAGALVTFLLYTKTFYQPIRQLVMNVLDSYEDARASSKRIVGLLEGDRPNRDEGRDLAVTGGEVAYEDVTFTYDGADEPTLTDVSFVAPSGSFVGVVGPTGAGKSTLTKLLFRFYEPDAGAVRVDGTDLRTVSRRSLREHLGYVSQDPFLFYGTVRENVAYGKPGASDEAIREAARRAGAHEFVRELPQSYDTQVGERGLSLSGGQRQRLAIARALLADPDVLVLDEATSHVDNETERRIQRYLHESAGERTTIAIAHRLSTVRNADLILVLDEGEVVERGTHDELLERGGRYADLWHVQVGDFEAVSDDFLASAPRPEVSR